MPKIYLFTLSICFSLATLPVLGNQQVLVPVGTNIEVTLDQRLDSGDAEVGDTFTMTVSESIAVDGRMAIPEGAVISGTVTGVEEAERPRKGGRLILRPDSLRAHGQVIPLQAEITAEGDDLEGKGGVQGSLKEIAIGAGLGAVLGGIIKGGKGALVGLIIGGAGTFLATEGEDVELDPETPLVVQLKQAVDVEIR
ncbi:MAG: hypothetical protein ACRD1R_02015 [Acidobacteriota bacterium]